MEPLRRRIEDLLVRNFGWHVNHWFICRVVDRIMIEVENEIAEAKEATTDEGATRRELPL
jgi:hypothetical protein